MKSIRKAHAFHERPLARDCNPMFVIVGGWLFLLVVATKSTQEFISLAF